MNRVELHNEPYNSGDSRLLSFGLKGALRLFVCLVVILIATSAPLAFADAPVSGYLGHKNLVNRMNVPTGGPATASRFKARYHRGLADLELEQAVRRAAQQH